MNKYIVKFKSTKKYEPDIERTVTVESNTLTDAQRAFKRRFKEVNIISFDECEEDQKIKESK